MSFKEHSRITGKNTHAFLSPSKYHWLEYDDDKLRRVFFESRQAQRGIELHDYAQRAITLGIKQSDNGTTLSRYINDCIGFRMEAEVPLYYSDDCFGTADACGYRESILRVSDLKTGISPASMKQPLIYSALFYLQFSNLAHPNDNRTILKIYQNDAVEEWEPDPAEIIIVMETIKSHSMMLQYLREEDL